MNAKKGEKDVDKAMRSGAGGRYACGNRFKLRINGFNVVLAWSLSPRSGYKNCIHTIGYFNFYGVDSA